MSRKNKFPAESRPEADLRAERAEEELSRSESRIAAILAIAADAIISLDDEMRITLFNEGAERLFGYGQAEILGQSLDRLIPQRFRSRHHKDVRDFAASPVAARRMGVADELAHEIAGAVLEVATTWRDYMTDAGVGASDLALLERCFAMREVVERWHDKRPEP